MIVLKDLAKHAHNTHTHTERERCNSTCSDKKTTHGMKGLQLSGGNIHHVPPHPFLTLVSTIEQAICFTYARSAACGIRTDSLVRPIWMMKDTPAGV